MFAFTLFPLEKHFPLQAETQFFPLGIYNNMPRVEKGFRFPFPSSPWTTSPKGEFAL